MSRLAAVALACAAAAVGPLLSLLAWKVGGIPWGAAAFAITTVLSLLMLVSTLAGTMRRQRR